MPNNDLLSEVLDLVKGDDWDGAFTNWGVWRFDMAKSELWSRLKVVGFLE